MVGGVEIEPWAGVGGNTVVGEGLILPSEFERVGEAVFRVELGNVRGKCGGITCSSGNIDKR